jgi:arylformamidase
VLLDVTRPVGPGTAPYPGDAPFEVSMTSTLDPSGGGANTCALRASTHLGTHVDAPWHVLPGGAKAHALPLDAFHGPARVLDLRGMGPLLEPSTVVGRLAGAERVLLRTRDRSGEDFDPAFAAPTPALAQALVEAGVRLVGTDAPSVDPFGSEVLQAHQALARGGCMILEGLDLAMAPEGDYELWALPLRWALDASPVRAVLRRSP